MINVVVGILHKQNRLFLQQRPLDKIHGMKWEFPGCKVHNGESKKEALHRGLYKELGISVSNDDVKMYGCHVVKETLIPDYQIKISYYGVDKWENRLIPKNNQPYMGFYTSDDIKLLRTLEGVHWFVKNMW